MRSFASRAVCNFCASAIPPGWGGFCAKAGPDNVEKIQRRPQKQSRTHRWPDTPTRLTHIRWSSHATGIIPSERCASYSILPRLLYGLPTDVLPEWVSRKSPVRIGSETKAHSKECVD